MIMSLIRYAPFPLGTFGQQINRMFDQFDSDLRSGSEELGNGMFAPAVDVKEDPSSYIVHLEVPGVAREQIQIALQENVLTVRGQKIAAQEKVEGQFRRVERVYGSFARSLTLPRPVRADGVTANLRDGVLEIVLPKQEQAVPVQIAVGITHEAEKTEKAQDNEGVDASSS